MMHAETASVSHCSRLQPKISHSQFQATSWSESHSLGTRDRKDANITAWYQDVSVRHGSANQTMEMSRSFNAFFYVIYEWRFWCHACHGLLSSFSGTISLNSSRWESCVGPSWFARSNPNASNRIITSHPMPLPHISRLLELRKVNLPWLLVQNQTQHVTFLLPWLMPTSKTYWSSDPTQAQLCQTYFWFVLSLMHWHCAMFVGSFHWWNWARWWSTGAIAF